MLPALANEAMDAQKTWTTTIGEDNDEDDQETGDETKKSASRLVRLV